jgi:hypothetical protein
MEPDGLHGLSRLPRIDHVVTTLTMRLHNCAFVPSA